MKRSILFLSGILFFFSVAAPVPADDRAEIEAYPKADEQSVVVMETGFDTPDFAERALPRGYRIRAGEGRNGTSALFYERTDPEEYRLFSIPLKNLEPGGFYVVSLWIRGEHVKSSGSGNATGVCVEYSENNRWAGGFYHSLDDVGPKWQQISLSFTAKEQISGIWVTFYMARGFTGKLWFDDVVIRTETVAPTLLLKRPDRLSFFGDDDRFVIRTDHEAPKNAAILASINQGETTRRLLLEPESPGSLDFIGNAGPLEPGPVEIVASLADRDARVIVACDRFLLQVRPSEETPPNACIIDEYGRAIVGGKPFMPLGVYGFADETNYRRLADAGFNCLQLYNSLGLRGNVDHKDRAKNILDGMDLIDKHGLKLIFSLKDQFEHHPSPIRSWEDAQTVDAVSEKAVRTIKDHPALLAWYVSDEELRKDVPKILEMRRRISRIDPWHPTWTLTYRYDDLPYYGISGDLIGVDPYPISKDKDKTEQSIKLIETAMKAGLSTGLPVWAVPQIFNWGVYHHRNDAEAFAKTTFPSLEEMRAMALFCAVLGAKGFVFYSNFDIIQRYEVLMPGSGEREWAKVVEMVKPIKALEPFILSTNKPLVIPVRSEPKDAVVAGALLDDSGGFRVIVIGTGGPAKGIFTLPDELLRLKKEPLRSGFGKTRFLGDGQYEFVVEAVDSDLLD